MIHLMSGAVSGCSSYLVRIEIVLRQGLPSFELVGLPGQSLRESRTRVQAAIRTNGFRFPLQRLTVNLAPSGKPKDGAAFDLPLALGILAAAGEISLDHWSSLVIAGELSLDGALRAIPDGVAIAVLAHKERRPLLLPEEQRPQIEALGLEAYYVSSLRDAVTMARKKAFEPLPTAGKMELVQNASQMLHPVRGQETAKRAVQIAGAGRHHLLFVGPPGTGKSMLAENLVHYLPELAKEEWLDINAVYSSTHQLPPGKIIQNRPMRVPHHGLPKKALFGYQRNAGEVTLADQGVLVLNELPLYSREALQQLCDTLDRQSVQVRWGNEALTFPARFCLAATANPCPCGFRGHPRRPCTCLGSQLTHYRQRLLGPLLDRIDIVVYTPARTAEDARENVVHPERGKASANGWMDTAVVTDWTIDTSAEALLRRAVEKLKLTMRGRDKTIRVAKTIAELEGDGEIRSPHVAEALQYRSEAQDFS